MKYCEHCGGKLTGEEKYCKHCGKKVSTAKDPLIEKAQEYASDDYSPALPIYKLVLFSIATLGIYEVVWYYRNFNRLKKLGKVKGNTLLRTIFIGLTMYFVMDGVVSLVKEKTDLKELPSAGWLAFAYFILLALGRLPHGWGFISVFTFLPLIPIQKALNYYYAEKSPRQKPREGLTFGEGLLVVLGSCLVLISFLAVVGSTNPTSGAATTAAPTLPPFINTASYDTPTPADQSIVQGFDTSFMQSCNSNGNEYTYCSCVLDYLHNNYTIPQIVQIGIDYQNTGQFPQDLKTGISNECIQYYQ